MSKKNFNLTRKNNKKVKQIKRRNAHLYSHHYKSFFAGMNVESMYPYSAPVVTPSVSS